MAQYKVLALSFINNMIVEEGDVVDYDGQPSDNLEAVQPEPAPAPPEAVVEHADQSGKGSGKSKVG